MNAAIIDRSNDIRWSKGKIPLKQIEGTNSEGKIDANKVDLSHLSGFGRGTYITQKDFEHNSNEMLFTNEPFPNEINSFSQNKNGPVLYQDFTGQILSSNYFVSVGNEFPSYSYKLQIKNKIQGNNSYLGIRDGDIFYLYRKDIQIPWGPWEIIQIYTQGLIDDSYKYLIDFKINNNILEILLGSTSLNDKPRLIKYNINEKVYTVEDFTLNSEEYGYYIDIIETNDDIYYLRAWNLSGTNYVLGCQSTGKEINIGNIISSEQRTGIYNSRIVETSKGYYCILERQIFKLTLDCKNLAVSEPIKNDGSWISINSNLNEIYGFYNNKPAIFHLDTEMIETISQTQSDILLLWRLKKNETSVNIFTDNKFSKLYLDESLDQTVNSHISNNNKFSPIAFRNFIDLGGSYCQNEKYLFTTEFLERAPLVPQLGGINDIYQQSFTFIKISGEKSQNEGEEAQS